MKLSNTQVEVLTDIYLERPISGRSRTIQSLIRRDLIDEDLELTQKGTNIVSEIAIDYETGDVMDAAFYLGKAVVEKPEYMAIIGVSALLGGLVRRVLK